MRARHAQHTQGHCYLPEPSRDIRNAGLRSESSQLTFFPHINPMGVFLWSLNVKINSESVNLNVPIQITFQKQLQIQSRGRGKQSRSNSADVDKYQETQVHSLQIWTSLALSVRDHPVQSAQSTRKCIGFPPAAYAYPFGDKTKINWSNCSNVAIKIESRIETPPKNTI